MRIDLPSNAVVVVAGVPGAGKTTLIDRAVDRAHVQVVDTEDQRRAGHRRRPRVVRVLVHYARILRAVLGREPAVIHSRGTTMVARRAVVVLARLRGKPAHLVLLGASAQQAVAGQVARGRTIAPAEMRGHLRRFARLAAAGPQTVARREGWAAVHAMTREQAAAVDVLRPVAPAGRPALVGSPQRRRALAHPIGAALATVGAAEFVDRAALLMPIAG